MRNLKKLTTVTGVMVLSLTANAELVPLTDETMSNATGQAGITLEIVESEITIGEVAYKDGGSIFINNMKIGGAGIVESLRNDPVENGLKFDNAKWELDIVGGGSDSSALMSNWGLNRMTTNGGWTEVTNIGDHGETAAIIDDGDLVLTAFETEAGEGVDYGLIIDRVSLGDSSIAAGDGESNPGATLISNFWSSGTVGPVDIVVDGNENMIDINVYVEQETDMTIENLNTSFTVKFHNRRGDDQLVYRSTTTGKEVSYAHVQAKIGAATDPADGLRLNIMDISGEMDIENIVIGNEPSIGNIYMTDLAISADLTVKGH